MEPPSTSSRAFDAAHPAWLGCGVDALLLRLHRVSSQRVYAVTHRCFHASCCLAVSNARVALPNFYNIAIRIANVAACLAVLGLRLSDELGSSTSPKFITRLNICNADIHEAVDCIGVGGDAERYRWFVGCRAAPDVDNEPRVRDLDVTRAPLLSPLLRMRLPKTVS